MSRFEDDNLLPASLSARIIESIRYVSCQAATCYAVTFRPSKDEPIDLKNAWRVGIDVYGMTEHIVRHGNYGFLPDSFDDKDALSIASRGAISPGTHYPQQMGLIVAHVGFDTAAQCWGSISPQDIEKNAILESAAASAYYYTQSAGFSNKDANKAATLVAKHLVKSFMAPNSVEYLATVIEDINSGRFEHVRLPKIGKHPNPGVFNQGINAGFVSAKFCMEQLGEPPPDRTRCREPLYRRRHPDSRANHG